MGVRLFSRNLESQNQRYPRLVEQLCLYFTSNRIVNCILDAELMTTDEHGVVKTFQQQQNSRKSRYIRQPNQVLQSPLVSLQSTTMSLHSTLPSQSDYHKNQEKIFIFDAIFVNSTNLIKQSLSVRKDFVTRYFPVDKHVGHVESSVFDLSSNKDVEEIQSLVKKYIHNRQEGAMIKSLDSSTFYDTNGRTQWVKLKKSFLTGGVADTLDVIPIAAYYGKGRRLSLQTFAFIKTSSSPCLIRKGTFGAYLLGCYDEEKEKYIALCKIGTGFTDDFLQTSTERLKSKVVKAKPEEYEAHRTFKPDVWFSKNVEVWEVQCESMSYSPIYTIGKGCFQNNKGLSLRFPRFIRIRPDKTAHNSTTVSQVSTSYNPYSLKKQLLEQFNYKVLELYHESIKTQ